MARPARDRDPVPLILFVFLDGVGLGDADSNPFSRARIPALEGLLEGHRPLRDHAPYHGRRASLVGVDATHATPGIPQSGTGHTTLLTGENAVTRFGRHYGPWVPTTLRPLVARRSILALAREAGLDVAFANAYPEELVRRVPRDRPLEEVLRSRRLGPLRSGPALAALGAGLLDRHTEALQRGDAVASEITNDGWIRRLGRSSLPRPTPRHAGHTLAAIAARHQLTLFAHYTTDYVGHRGTFEDAVAAIERVDAFIAGILDGLPPEALLVVASDHGNIEDATRQHTRNPALALVVGPDHDRIARRLQQLWDVPASILEALGIRR
jgi:hypothetical protein